MRRRVKLTNPKSFFENVLEKKSLKNLSKKINVNYSTLKKWKGGDNLIPEDQFNRIIMHAKDKRYWLNCISFKKEGWGRSKGGKIAVSKLSKEELFRKLEKARSKIKIKNKIIKPAKLVLNKNLCEFYGILMGDGCLSKFKRSENVTRNQIIISGHKSLDKEYHEEYIKSLIKNEFNLTPYIYCRKKDNVRSFIINNKPFFKALVKLKFPIGKKGQKLEIPIRLLKLSWNLKKYIIRGLFDTDGCLTARKDEGYRYPCLIISSYSKPLIKQLYNMLRNKGYPFWVNKKNTEIRMRGIKNVNRWMFDIGCSNSKHKDKYEYWLKNKVLPSNLKTYKILPRDTLGP